VGVDNGRAECGPQQHREGDADQHKEACVKGAGGRRGRSSQVFGDYGGGEGN